MVRRPIALAGRERRRPVVGRHGRDHYTKWPSTPEAIRAAYCADKPCDVVILGGAQRALEVIGTKPRNWIIQKFGVMDARTFVSDLDFFIHYPNEDYIEEFGRAAIEAMALGVPVILPPVFRETFGEAALYAEPDEAWSTVAQLWSDEDSYLARARAGRDFVLANCAFDRLPRRLGNLESLRRSDETATAVSSGPIPYLGTEVPSTAPSPSRTVI